MKPVPKLLAMTCLSAGLLTLGSGVSAQEGPVSAEAQTTIRRMLSEGPFGPDTPRAKRIRAMNAFRLFMMKKPLPAGAATVVWRAANADLLDDGGRAVYENALRRMGDPALGARNLVKAGWAFNLGGKDSRTALDLLSRAEKLRPQDPETVAKIHLGRALAYRDLKDEARAFRHLERAKSVVRAHPEVSIGDIIASLEEPGRSFDPADNLNEGRSPRFRMPERRFNEARPVRAPEWLIPGWVLAGLIGVLVNRRRR